MQNRYDNQAVAKEQPVYAGFWVRLAAYLIDRIIVLAGLLVFRFLFFVAEMNTQNSFLETGILFQYTIVDILLYVLGALYFILCTYCTGTTLGKKAMNLRVISAETGEKPGITDIVYRETVGRFLSGLLMKLGYLVIGVSKEKCGFHDMLCDTRVIYEKRIRVSVIYPSAAQYVPSMMPEPPQSGAGIGSEIQMNPEQPGVLHASRSAVQQATQSDDMPWSRSKQSEVSDDAEEQPVQTFPQE